MLPCPTFRAADEGNTDEAADVEPVGRDERQFAFVNLAPVC